MRLVLWLRGKPPLDAEAIYWYYPHYHDHGTQWRPGAAVPAGRLETAKMPMLNSRFVPGIKRLKYW
ncbi:hypothetical protein MYX65_10930 [Acidobacteria bacterium AH-259-L09]|nr:hypothetical protein [Acidobacteria bacterium AH-259-L09]